MGYALAEACAMEGAEVVLVSGPVNLQAKHPNIHLIAVETAAEMYKACHEHFVECDIAILAAAVADFTPALKAAEKIKKKATKFSLELVQTKDILKSLGEIKTKNQLLVGFALETNNEIENAKGKLIKKNLDFIVLNSLQDKGAGFKHETNKITILDKYNKITKFELKDKRLVAKDILNYLRVIE